MIFYNPFYIFNLGFILSFMVTFFLLLISNIKVKSKVLSLLFSSIISFLAGIPIIINNFYEINIIGFINNIFFIPLVSNIIFPLSILTLLFNRLSVILKIFTNIMEYISFISSKFININLYFTKMDIISVIIYYLLLILTIKLRKKIFIFALLLLIIICYIKPYFNNETILYFIDVGQGDSALIKTKNNKYIMIDTGGKIDYYKDSWARKNNEFSLMKNSIIPFLKNIGSKQIDYLFLTHGDADHSGYAIDLVNNFKVKNIYINKGNINYLESKISNNILLDNYIKVDNVEIYSLNNTIYDDENKNSIVLLVKIYNYQILFLADASKEVEKDILNKYNLKNIDIIKLGHHGSNTSTSEELLQKTTPKECIISVSLNNKYNHPSIETLDLLNEYKIKYYETSKYGTINYYFSEKSIKLKTYNP